MKMIIALLIIVLGIIPLYILNRIYKENDTDLELLKVKKTALEIYKYKDKLSEQQYKVLIGLAKSGDTQGAIKGLHKILRRNKNGTRKAD